MARQSLSPMKNLDYVENAENADAVTTIREKVGRKRKDAPMTHLKYLRKKSGYTLETLSEVTNISISYLSRLESGSRRLNTDLIRRLSHAFSCSPAELLQDTMHESSVITPVEFNKVRRGTEFGFSSLPKELQLNEVVKTSDTDDTLCIRPVNPTEWKQCPSELSYCENVIALKAGEAFEPRFSKSSVLYLDASATLAPETTVVGLSGNKVFLKKIWSITPTSLQLCDISDIEALKAGKDVELLQLSRDSLNELYKLVAYFDLVD